MLQAAVGRVALLAASGILTGCTAAATLTQGPEPATAPPASSAPTAPSSITAGPPEGFLTVGGAAPLVGLRGSSCWTGPGSTVCDDTPWLVPEPGGSRVAADSPCAVTLASGTAITEWSIVAAPADATDPLGSAASLSARGIGRPVTEIAFACPSRGDWVIHAYVRAVAGDASYYWRLGIDRAAEPTS